MNNWWKAHKYVIVKHNSLLKNKFNQGWLVFSLHTCMALLSVAYSYLHFFCVFILQLLSVAWPSFSLIFLTPSKWRHSGGQPPAWQTKMVHSHPGAIKKDEQLTYVTLHVYAYDSTPSKPTLEKGCGCCFFIMSLIHIHKQMLLTTVDW